MRQPILALLAAVCRQRDLFAIKTSERRRKSAAHSPIRPFPLWRLSYGIIPYIRMKFEQHGLGFQNLYNIPQGVEVPRLTYQQFSNLIGNVTDI